MPYNPKAVSQTTRILFPIFVTVIAGTIAPQERGAYRLPHVWQPYT